MRLFIHLVLIFSLSLVLIKSTDLLILTLKKVSEEIKIGKFAFTSFLIALATSLPELFVGITAALEGKPALSLGNVIGSNIADLSLVAGGASLLGGSLLVKGSFLERDFFYTFLAGVAPLFLLYDGTLSRIDGLVLILIYGFYNVTVLKQKKTEKEGVLTTIFRRLQRKKTGRDFGIIFLSAALLLFSADLLVKIASKMAFSFNIPLLLIGIFVVGVGTSLPELAFETRAVLARQSSMFFGNLLGSVVANSTLIIGLTAFISPIKIQIFEEYLLASLFFGIIFLLFYIFVKSKKRLDRWEGVVLIFAYLVFLFLEAF